MRIDLKVKVFCVDYGQGQRGVGGEWGQTSATDVKERNSAKGHEEAVVSRCKIVLS